MSEIYCFIVEVMNKIIGENIRKLRILRGKNAKIIADALNISLSAYTKLERGETQIDMSRLVFIAKELDVSIEDITSFDSDELFQKVPHVNILGATTNLLNEGEQNFRILKDMVSCLVQQINSANELIKEQRKMISLLLGKNN